MTPTELADRLAAMDWSGTSLQHQLAVTCAVATLRKLEPPKPTAQILTLPTSHTIRLLSLEGTEFARRSFRDIRKAWAWVSETVATGWHVPASAVNCAAGWGGADVVTLDGLPICQVVHGLPEPLCFGSR